MTRLGGTSVQFPPLELLGPQVFLGRNYRGERALLVLPGGDTYEVDPETLRMWLHMHEWSDEDAGLLVDYLWNFYSVEVNMAERVFGWTSMEVVLDAAGTE